MHHMEKKSVNLVLGISGEKIFNCIYIYIHRTVIYFKNTKVVVCDVNAQNANGLGTILQRFSNKRKQSVIIEQKSI